MERNNTLLWGIVGLLVVVFLCLVLASVGYAAYNSLYQARTEGPTTSVGQEVQNEPVIPADQSAPVVIAATCPTEREFEQLVGVRADIVREEPCAFHWRGDPEITTAEHACPDGWSCTIGIADPRQTYQYSGDDNLPAMQIFAETWRLVNSYPAGDTVYNDCAMLAKVQHEGQISDPQWTAIAGNFNCP